MTAATTAVHASAPSRIDLAGGTLDIWPISLLVPQAVTVNLAVELRAEVEIETLRERKLVVRARDRGRQATRRLPLREDDARGPLALLVRLAAAFDPRRGLSLTSRAAAPAGAGLGGSSTLAMAAGAALARWTGERLAPMRLLERVMNIETVELGVPTGNQDYLAALHGGLAAYRHGIDGVRRTAIRIPRGLEERLVLAYTGQPRHSGFSNWEMYRRFVEGERATVRRMGSIARIARELTEALQSDDLDAAGRLVGEEGRLRFSLAPTVATDALRAADRAARRAGALGVKVCGAGGGGCLVAFAAEGRAAAVARAIAGTGARILPVEIARRGLRVSERKPGS
jgi:D-glycero-alpha-D-manno-heptose-7-phosphate kinase